MRTDAAMHDPRSAPAMPERSYWKVALALFTAMAIILTGAFVLNSQLRPRVGIEPAPAVSETVAATQQGGTGSQPTAQEILDAYSRYWQVRAEAYLNLDPSRLSEVMAGEELAEETKQILDYKARGRAVKADVVRNPIVVELRADRATVYDEYLDRSLFIDPQTKQPLPDDDAPVTEKVSYQFEKFGQTWKVVGGARHP